MNRHSQIATWLGATLGTACALVMLAVEAHASDYRGAVTEEFHQTYTLTPDGRVELDNINGPVHISAWDRNEVKVDAIKSASTKERLDEARIEIDAGKDYVSIRTKYRDRDQTWNDDNWHNNPPSVEYTVTVPRAAHLDEIKLINGSLDVAGVSGEVRASCINGKLEAKDLSGRAQLATVNGRLDARFSHLSGSALELNSVNGSVKLTIPSDAKAEVEANTFSGDIKNDFGLQAESHPVVRFATRSELAGGGARIKLKNVNGRIEIRHAEDGRALSPVKDLGGRNRDRDEDNDDDSKI